MTTQNLRLEKLRSLDAYRTRSQIAKDRFNLSSKVERDYARKLKAVAKQVGLIVDGMSDKGKIESPGKLIDALDDYSKLLKPWARSVAKRMIDAVGQRDSKAWYDLGREIGRSLNKEIESAPTGAMLVTLLEDQVDLITSLPSKAAKRVHELTIEGLGSGVRAAEIAAEIKRTGKVSEGRALLIARAEVARTASSLTQARATHVGSDGYFWRTAKDADVRDSHREMEGKFVRWDEPPTLSDGTVTHAGQVYNCRCYAEPVIKDLN